MRSIWRFVVDVSLRWYHGRVGDLAASITFWLVISLPALVLSLLAVLGPFDRLISGTVTSRLQAEVERFIERVFVDDSVISTVSGLFSETNNSLAVVSLALTLWSISRGFAGLIRALEDIYDIEDRRTWYHARVVAIVLGLGSMVVPVVLVLLDIYVWDLLPSSVFFDLVRRSVPPLVLVLWASVIYHFGPAQRHRWRLDLPGAVVAAIGWWLLTLGFGRYVALTSNANEVRAVVGGLLLSLTWLWLAAQVFLVGGAVNFLLGERLGVRRGRRSWTINEVVQKGTGEIRKVIVPDGSEVDEEDRNTNGRGFIRSVDLGRSAEPEGVHRS